MSDVPDGVFLRLNASPVC